MRGDRCHSGSVPLPTRSELLSLSPMRLERTRIRVPDPSMGVSMAEVPEEDALRLRAVYETLLELLAVLQGCAVDREAVARLAGVLPLLGVDALVDRVVMLGRALEREGMSPRLRRAYHDARGGSLQALLVHLELIEAGAGEPEDLHRVFLLARDHLKILRNAVPDLDPPRTQADLEERAHPVALVREKWSSVGYRMLGRTVEVELDCAFEGSIASCCMEFSTFDRIVYNLVHNAAEHAADGKVRVSVLPTADAPGSPLRIAVANRVRPEQRARLRERFGDDLGGIFDAGFTTGGHGLGLGICAELVTHGFSLSSVGAALEQGVLGAALVDDAFVAWVGWPSALAEARVELPARGGSPPPDPLVRAERRAI